MPGVMPRTGDNCERSGEYEGVDEHACVVSVTRGQEYPSCPNCGNPVEWQVVGSGEVP
jgi:hypothetical protein